MTRPMTSKPKAAPKAESLPADPERAARVAEWQKGIGQRIGRTGALLHNALAAELAGPFSPSGKLDQGDVAEGLKETSDEIVAGKMEGIERMLFGQMVALNAMAARYLERSAAHIGKDSLHIVEAYGRLGLKAQAQCARTAEVIGNLRAGPTIFAKQANVTSGPQQINNGVPARTQEPPKSENELLEDSRHERQWVDAGAPAAASGSDTKMATVGPEHRPKD